MHEIVQGTLYLEGILLVRCIYLSAVDVGQLTKYRGFGRLQHTRSHIHHTRWKSADSLLPPARVTPTMITRLVIICLFSVLWVPIALVTSSSIQTYSRCFGNAISRQLYEQISKTSELAAISYCVGREGIQKPFNCLNRCGHFPELVLAQVR